MSGGCDEIFVKEKKKKERKRDKPLCHGLSRRRQKRIRFGQRQMAGNGSKSVASGGRHGRVRGVNRLGSKRSFVRLVSGRVRACSFRFLGTIYERRVDHASQPEVAVPFVPPPSFLRKRRRRRRRRRKAPFIAFFPPRPRPALLNRTGKREWIESRFLTVIDANRTSNTFLLSQFTFCLLIKSRLWKIDLKNIFVFASITNIRRGKELSWSTFFNLRNSTLFPNFQPELDE